jgi:ribose/xylose/arabinose/galactoside ABC-type transport system permease subunit
MLRTASHRKRKPVAVFGAPAAAIAVGVACGLIGASMWTRSRGTAFVLLIIAFCAFSLMTYLYLKED